MTSKPRCSGHTHQQRSEAVRDEEEVHDFDEGEQEGNGEESLADEGQVELAPLGPGQVDVVVALDVDVRHDPEHEGGREEDEHHQRVPDARQLTAHTWFTVGDGLVNTHYDSHLIHSRRWISEHSHLVHSRRWISEHSHLVHSRRWISEHSHLVYSRRWISEHSLRLTLGSQSAMD